MTELTAILHSLKINGRCVQAKRHRHLAYYDIQLENGDTVRKIENKTREIALGLKTKTTPIVKLIPEEGVVRLQVAVGEADTILLEDLFEGQEIPPISQSGLLPFILGETDEGQKLWVDMAKNPHLLVAGETGSGKSVLLHTVITNAAYLKGCGARNIELYLCDPKRVEFGIYNNSKMNTLVKQFTFDYNETLKLLEFIEFQMNTRYEILAEKGLQNVSEAPYLFPSTMVIIDEVADLMLQDKKTHRFENLIVKLAQKARAAGIYLLLATQRPSTDILTGLIKANFPARVACRVGSRVDSQVILDSIGAENLLGRGDAILKNPQRNARFQVAFSDPSKTVKHFSVLERWRPM